MPIERFTLIIKRLLMLYFLSALKEGSRKWSNFCGNIQEWYTGNGTRLEYDAFLGGRRPKILNLATLKWDL